MPLEDAVRPSADGVLFEFDVSPGARKTEVPSGYNEWRKRIEVKLKAPPEKGKANEELLQALATIFQVPTSRIEITSGATNSKKSILIHGLDREKALGVLRGLV